MEVYFFAKIDISWPFLCRFSKLSVSFASKEFIANDLTICNICHKCLGNICNIWAPPTLFPLCRHFFRCQPSFLHYKQISVAIPDHRKSKLSKNVLIEKDIQLFSLNISKKNEKQIKAHRSYFERISVSPYSNFYLLLRCTILYLQNKFIMIPMEKILVQSQQQRHSSSIHECCYNAFVRPFEQLF